MFKKCTKGNKSKKTNKLNCYGGNSANKVVVKNNIVECKLFLGFVTFEKYYHSLYLHILYENTSWLKSIIIHWDSRSKVN